MFVLYVTLVLKGILTAGFNLHRKEAISQTICFTLDSSKSLESTPTRLITPSETLPDFYVSSADVENKT